MQVHDCTVYMYMYMYMYVYCMYTYTCNYVIVLCFTFQSRPLIDESYSNVEKLINRIDDFEAKCLYCGGKMDTLIATLQEEITQLTGLNDETENTLLLSVAGLKHVRVNLFCFCFCT